MCVCMINYENIDGGEWTRKNATKMQKVSKAWNS